MITLQNVTFTYAGSERESGLRSINLTINEGEVVLLCGASGCGKTTLTRLVNGLIPHYHEGTLSGEVLIGGTNVCTASMQETSRLVGSVFQNPRSQFFNVDTTSELAFGCENNGQPVEEIRQRMAETVAEMHIEGLMGRSIFRLSGGEKQKIACASVSVQGPPVMVLDEPSSNLDTETVEELRKLIGLWKAKGKTVIIAEHRLYYLRELIDRVIYMQDGEIVHDYTAEAFLALPPQETARLGLRPLSLLNLAPACHAAQMPGAELTVSRFSYTYRHTMEPAVDIEHCSIPQSAIIAIVGKNGAGKSTFARCLCGFEKKCKGELVTPAGTLKNRQLLKKTYMVMQDVNHQLFTESVLDEVLLGMKEPREKEAEAILEELDLLELKGLHPMSLSGGQKQRVAIAGALASDRDYILFDEPTSGLDLGHMHEVALVLQKLHRQGKTVFVITHDLELIMACCTHALQLENGQAKGLYQMDAAGAKKVSAIFGNCGEPALAQPEYNAVVTDSNAWNNVKP